MELLVRPSNRLGEEEGRGGRRGGELNKEKNNNIIHTYIKVQNTKLLVCMVLHALYRHQIDNNTHSHIT